MSVWFDWLSRMGRDTKGLVEPETACTPNAFALFCGAIMIFLATLDRYRPGDPKPNKTLLNRNYQGFSALRG